MTPQESWDRLKRLYVHGDVELTEVEMLTLAEFGGVGDLMRMFSPENSRLAADKTRYLGAFERHSASPVHKIHRGRVPDSEIFRPTEANLRALVAECDFGPDGQHPELMPFLMDIATKEE
jgi:hypothetical protein